MFIYCRIRSTCKTLATKAIGHVDQYHNNNQNNLNNNQNCAIDPNANQKDQCRRFDWH